MVAIYQAALWCDDCAEDIKDRIANELFDRQGELEFPDGWVAEGFEDTADVRNHLDGMSEYDYDSDEYPKGCSGSDESDCPEHCDGCGVFLENDLTSEGADYVVRTVRENRLEGRNDTVACTVWAEFYNYLDLPHWGVCDDCGVEAMIDDYDVCEDGCDWSGESGNDYDLPCTD